MNAAGPDVALASAVRTFIDCLPRPIAYSRDASSYPLQRIVAPRAALFVLPLDRLEHAALARVERTATRTRTDGIVLSRHPANAKLLRFDLVLRRHARSATFANYTFRETVGGGLFEPVGSGRLVHLDAGGLTPGEEVYFRMADGRLAAVDRAANNRTTRYFESI